MAFEIIFISSKHLLVKDPICFPGKLLVIVVELLPGLGCLMLGTELLDPVFHCICTEKDGTHAAKGQRYNRALRYAALLTTRPP